MGCGSHRCHCPLSLKSFPSDMKNLKCKLSPNDKCQDHELHPEPLQLSQAEVMWKMTSAQRQFTPPDEECCLENRVDMYAQLLSQALNKSWFFYMIHWTCMFMRYPIGHNSWQNNHTLHIIWMLAMQGEYSLFNMVNMVLSHGGIKPPNRAALLRPRVCS